MSTFLEFICHNLIGPCLYSNGNGESYYDCPACDSDSFHTMPHKPPYKDRAKCWACDFLGDAMDVVKELSPALNYDGRLNLLADLQKAFKKMNPNDQDTNSPPRGQASKEEQEHAKRLHHAFADLCLMPEENDHGLRPMLFLIHARNVALEYELSMNDLIDNVQEYVDWVRDVDARMKQREQEEQDASKRKAAAKKKIRATMAKRAKAGKSMAR